MLSGCDASWTKGGSGKRFSSTPVHIAAMAGIFYWDKANTENAFKAIYTIEIVWLVGVVEMCCIVGIIELWKPSSEK